MFAAISCNQGILKIYEIYDNEVHILDKVFWIRLIEPFFLQLFGKYGHVLFEICPFFTVIRKMWACFSKKVPFIYIY